MAAGLVAGLGLAAACAERPPMPPPPGRSPIFDPTVLHEVEVAMDPLDWQALRDNFQSNQYYPADVALDGERVPQAGVRSRGGATRSPIKPSLQLQFDEYARAQRFHGLRRVAVKNLTDDSSFLREYLSMATYEAIGIAAPAVSFARLTVNGEYWGLYNLIESVEDEAFLGAHFGESQGQLYQYEYPGAPYDFSYRGDDAASYVPRPFKPELREEDDADPAGLLALIRTINSGPDETFAQSIAPFLDPGQVLTFLAVENAVTAGDALVGIFGMNNFYLYQYAGGSRFVFIPWDRGATFQNPGWPLFYRIDSNVLTRRLLADPGLTRVYLDALRRTVTEFLNEERLGTRLEAAYTLIREAVLTDPHKPYGGDDFELGVEDVRSVVAGRRNDVLRQLDALEAPAGAVHLP